MKSVYAFGLSVCLSVRLSVRLSVCPRSNSRKYSSNVLKLIYVIYIWHSMNRIENGIHKTNGLFRETHKSFPIHYGLWGEIFKAYFKVFIISKGDTGCVSKKTSIRKNTFISKIHWNFGRLHSGNSINLNGKYCFYENFRWWTHREWRDRWGRWGLIMLKFE